MTAEPPRIFSEEDVREIRFGEKSVLIWLPDQHDHIQKTIRASGSFYELDLLAETLERAKPDNVVIDVGANIGNHTLFWAAICGASVIAVEPNPSALEILYKNLALNNIETRVSVIDCAVSNRAGRGELAESQADNMGTAALRSDSGGSIRVDTVDRIASEGNVSLIKVDTEGHDLNVLKGAAAVLSRTSPFIYCEAGDDETRVLIDQYLGSKGYHRIRRYCHTPTHLYVPPGELRSPGQQLRLTTDEIGANIARTEKAIRSDLNRNKVDSERFYAELKKVGTSLAKERSDSLSCYKANSQEIQAELRSLRSIAEKALQDGIEPERRRADRKVEELKRESERAANDFKKTIYNLESQVNKLQADRQLADRKLEESFRQLARFRVESETQAKSANQKSEEARLLRESVSYRLGNAFVELIAAPVSGLAKFPGRILGLFRRREPDVQKSRHMSPTPHISTMALSKESDGSQAQQHLPRDRFRKGKVIFEEFPTSGFGSWFANQNVRLDPGGKVYINQSFSTPGVVRECDVEENRVYRFDVCSVTPPSVGEVCIGVRSETHGQMLTPLYPVSDSSNASVIFRVPSGCESVRLIVAVRNPNASDHFVLRKAALSEQIDAWEHNGPERPYLSYRTVAGIASIPSRADALSDAVASLLPQVDEIRVFLNGYASVPNWLQKTPRIRVFRSQDFADYGDAGKFFGVDPYQPEYYVTCDDDIIYPVDYVDSLLSELSRRKDKAVVGVHGVLLKQPVKNYYSSADRYVFRHVKDLPHAVSVHVLGTGTTAFRTDILGMRFRELQAPNMADIWLSSQAQLNRIPLVSIPRRSDWLVQNQAASVSESIYKASSSGSTSAMNSGMLQTFVLRQMQPFTIYPDPALRQPLKVVLAITTFNRKDYLAHCIKSFLETLDDSFCWSLIVADDGSTDGTLEYLESLNIPVELHVIRNQRRYAVGQTNEIFELASSIGFDFGFKADDDVVFKEQGWARLYMEACRASGFDHLCYLNEAHFKELRRKQDKDFEPVPEADPSGKLVSYASVEKCMGAFFTFTPRMIELVGYADEVNFPVRGQWHIDLSARACRAGLNDSRTFFDVRDSNRFIDLQNNITEDYRCSIPWREYGDQVSNPKELARRITLIRDPARLRLSREESFPCSHVPAEARPRRDFNHVFDKVFVLNLARRSDRLEKFAGRAGWAGIEFERFEAADGAEDKYRSAWEEYSRLPLQEVPDQATPVTSTRQYYLDYDSQAARLAFLEQKLGGKAIQTPGAWGYLETMKQLLEHAIDREYESIVVFDDDAIFHRGFQARFANLYANVPSDWKILQLGSLQYHWSDEWIEWCGTHLYRDYGTGLGSHAVAIRASVFPMLLDHCRRFLLPYDEGALHYVRRAWPEDCYTVFPNLVIQDVSESDINSSVTQSSEGANPQNRYRWELSDYVFEPGEDDL